MNEHNSKQENFWFRLKQAETICDENMFMEVAREYVTITSDQYPASFRGLEMDLRKRGFSVYAIAIPLYSSSTASTASTSCFFLGDGLQRNIYTLQHYNMLKERRQKYCLQKQKQQIDVEFKEEIIDTTGKLLNPFKYQLSFTCNINSIYLYWPSLDHNLQALEQTGFIILPSESSKCNKIK